jgi:hypothetical protein
MLLVEPAKGMEAKVALAAERSTLHRELSVPT